jgi:hypothetical protein
MADDGPKKKVDFIYEEYDSWSDVRVKVDFLRTQAQPDDFSFLKKICRLFVTRRLNFGNVVIPRTETIPNLFVKYLQIKNVIGDHAVPGMGLDLSS